MKKIIVAFIILSMVFASSIGFAAGIEGERQSAVTEKVLCTIKDLPVAWTTWFQTIKYNLMDQTVYILAYVQEGDEEPYKKQFVYTLDGESVDKPSYPMVEGHERISIDFSDKIGLMTDLTPDGVVLSDSNGNKMLMKDNVTSNIFFVRVKGDLMAYKTTVNGQKPHRFVVGEMNPFLFVEENEHLFRTPFSRFDLSSDGESIIFLYAYQRPKDEQDTTSERIIDFSSYVYNLSSREMQKYPVRINPGQSWILTYDMYETGGQLISLTDDCGLKATMLERISYEGEIFEGIELNREAHACRITEGPNGSTLYLRRAVSAEDGETFLKDQWELVQVNWTDSADQTETEKTTASGMRPLIRERVKQDSTIAVFNNHGFGLYKRLDPSTEAFDYVAPLRTQESQVRLQIPYSDVKAKCESGSRNLVVEYKDQTIALPMILFDCDDLLASMPCQDEATIEIILKADEAGNVNYYVQLFVVEEVNGMTKLVHRKTIQ